MAQLSWDYPPTRVARLGGVNDHKARKRRIAQITRQGTDLAAETYREGITWDELVQIRDQLAALDAERQSLFGLMAFSKKETHGEQNG